MKNNILHIATAGILVLLLVLLVDPFMLWMPPMAAMGVLLATAVLLCVWAGFIMHEKVADERESLHRLHAGLFAYLAGIAVLTFALVVQGLSHHIDPWIALALGVMVSVKLGARMFADIYR